jgi:K+-transporting ATPase ATPase C chain
MKNIIRQSIVLCIAMLIICGIIYPLTVTGLGQLFFKKQANGSIIEYKGSKVGSELLGQSFTDTRFFHGRISSVNYNTYKKEDIVPDSNGKAVYTGVASGSSNLAPSNKALEDRIKKDLDEFLKSHEGTDKSKIPVDLLTSSGSGLDPDISPEAAYVQIPLISKTTGISEDELNNIVKKNTTGRQLGIFGEKRVNILKVNLEIAKRLNI